MPFSSLENFANPYEKEELLQKELEKIEVVSMKLKERYKGYKDLVEFVDYLRSSEEIFLMSKAKRWNAEQLKEELIKNELHLTSVNTGVDESVFQDIHNDFKSVALNVGKLYQVADELLKKYSDDQYREFILYLRDISLIFVKFQEEKIDIDNARDRLFRVRMKVLSADGNPELGALEKIYEEFRQGLGIK